MTKRILTGKVTSNKTEKTITLLVERKIMHPIYKKFETNSISSESNRERSNKSSGTPKPKTHFPLNQDDGSLEGR